MLPEIIKIFYGKLKKYTTVKYLENRKQNSLEVPEYAYLIYELSDNCNIEKFLYFLTSFKQLEDNVFKSETCYFTFTISQYYLLLVSTLIIMLRLRYFINISIFHVFYFYQHS